MYNLSMKERLIIIKVYNNKPIDIENHKETINTLIKKELLIENSGTYLLTTYGLIIYDSFNILEFYNIYITNLLNNRVLHTRLEKNHALSMFKRYKLYSKISVLLLKDYEIEKLKKMEKLYNFENIERLDYIDFLTQIFMIFVGSK